MASQKPLVCFSSLCSATFQKPSMILSKASHKKPLFIRVSHSGETGGRVCEGFSPSPPAGLHTINKMWKRAPIQRGHVNVLAPVRGERGGGGSLGVLTGVRKVRIQMVSKLNRNS